MTQSRKQSHPLTNKKRRDVGRRNDQPFGFLQEHSLSLAAVGVVVLLIALYSRSNPDTHLGTFFGNAIADWTGVCVTIIATKHLYERGSRESKTPKPTAVSPVIQKLMQHSLSIFLVITGAAWVALFVHMSPTSRWGEVVGNIVSEWTQILGLVWLTKRLFEVGSKEDAS